MKLIAIDPGPIESAFIFLNNSDIIQYGIVANFEMLEIIRTNQFPESIYIIEDIQCFGMPVGRAVFETVKFIGRLQEATHQAHIIMNFVYRREIKLYFCGTARAKDANVRQVLIDRFGEPGTKLRPNKLYGIKKDIWQALAIGIYWHDTH